MTGSSKKSYKSENKAYIEGMRQIRRSSAAGTHADKRTKRARTRSAAKRKAIGSF
jgi:hypothetical protein